MSINQAACEASPLGKSCAKGSWCCLDSSDPINLQSVCVPCKHTLFGHCLYETDGDVCGGRGFKTWNSLSDLQDLARSEGEALVKEAAQALLCHYVPSECK